MCFQPQPSTDSTEPEPGVLVIGGTGFLGRAIVRQLIRDGRTVHTLSRRPSQEADSALGRVVPYVGDANHARDFVEALGALSAVVCAFGTAYPAAATPQVGSDGFEPFAAVLEHLKTVDRVIDLTVLSSGGTVYGDGHEPFRETDPLQPSTAYGRLMSAVEYAVDEARADTDGVTRILRVANAYGHTQRLDRDQGFIGHALAAARSGRPVTIYGDGSAVRDFLDVRDVGHAVSTLVGNHLAEGAINIGTGVGTSLVGCLGLIEGALGHAVERNHVAARDFDLNTSVLNVDRLRSLMQWRPVPLAAGVSALTSETPDRSHIVAVPA